MLQLIFSHLCYQQEILQYAHQFSGFQYIPVVTSDPDNSTTIKSLLHRIPDLLQSNALTKFTNIQFSAQDSVVLLCGHPEMIKHSIHLLKEKGLTKHRRRSPGNILSERYF